MLQNGASWNRIGTGTPGGANVIGSSAIQLTDAATAHNRIQGNFIGAGFLGSANLGGNSGVSLTEASYNIVGGRNQNEGNLLAGSDGSSIWLSNLAHGNQIIGNTIGVDITGTKVIGLGGIGVDIETGAYHNVVEANTMAGAGWGLTLLVFGTSFNQVIGNRIGFDPSGKVVLGASGGIVEEHTQFNRIGGSRSQDRNLITGPQGASVFLSVGLGEIIMGNNFGANVDGVPAGSQAYGGISMTPAARRCTIGGASGSEGNLILGVPNSGITVSGKRNLVQGNVVGIDSQGTPRPNQNGISSGGGQRDNIIQGNTIAGNQRYGGNSTFGDRSTFRRNAVYDNSGGGLMLGCTDAAHCVDAPVLTIVGATNVSGKACPNCEVEVFSDAASQGRYFEASGIANAQGAFSIPLSTPLRGPHVTATATDPDGNTSTFSTPWQLAN
jgi:hypothetical protein